MSYQWAKEEKKFATADSIFGKTSGLLKPPPNITPTEWSEKFRFFSDADREPGRYRVSRTPYVKGIMDALSPSSPYWKIAVMKSVQLGLTVAALNWIGYTIHLNPQPILAVYPKDEDVRKWIKNKFWPMMDSTPVLNGKIAPPGKKSSGNTQSYMTFPGGYIVPTSAGSPRNFRSTSFCIVIVDECDAFMASLGDDGSVIELIDGRTTAFEGKGRKILYISTPLVKGRSIIEEQFLNGDQRRYFVPCYFCGFEQRLKIEKLTWEMNEDNHIVTDSIGYLCDNCNKAIPENHKSGMVENGVWRPTATPKEPGFASFQINSLNSQFVSYEFLIYKYLAAKKDLEKKRTFCNQWMGEPFEEPIVEVADPELLKKRAENLGHKVPAGGLLLTCGVDVQKNRLHYAIFAWGKDYECWVLEYDILAGNPLESGVWDNLDKVLKEKWCHALDNNIELPIAATFVDMGYLSDTVCKFTSKRAVRRVFAVKGSAIYGKPIVGELKSRPSGKIRPLMANIGTDTAKNHIFQSLQVKNPGPEYVHFSKRLPDSFYKELTAEHQVLKEGRTVWKKKHSDISNEGLDVFVYALAAAKHLNPDTSYIEEKLFKKKVKSKNKSKNNNTDRYTRINLDYVNGWKA